MWNSENIWKLRGFHEKIWEMQKFGDIRLLSIISKHESINGAELLNELQNLNDSRMRQFHTLRMNLMSNAGYRCHKPSPSYLYPALKKMESEGLIHKNEADEYELTNKGRDALNEVHGFSRSENSETTGVLTIEDVLTELDSYISYLEDIEKEKLESKTEYIGSMIERLKKIKESI